jgi:glucans biosynthesis protein C
VLYHVGMLCVPWDFHVKHPPAYAVLEPLMRPTNPWRMSLLFVISGLAAPGAARAAAGLPARAAVPALRQNACAGRRWAAHAAFVPLFAFGVLLARRRVLLQRLQDLRWPALALGLAGWAVLVLYPGTVRGWPAVPEGLRVPMRLALATARWCGIVAAFGFARRQLDFDHRWRAPLTEAVFPLYLVHQTIIIVAAVALRPLVLPAGVESTVIVVLTFAGGWAAWRLARRIGWLRPWMGLSWARSSVPALQRAAVTNA